MEKMNNPKKIIFVDPYLKDFVFTQYDPSFSFVPFHSLLDIVMPSYSICAIGDNALRRQVILAHAKDSFASVISNEAIVSKFCNISPGVFIAPGAVVNAGIYVISPSTLNYIVKGDACDMPDFLMKLKSKSCRVNAYPVHETWADVGRPIDLSKINTENSEK